MSEVKILHNYVCDEMEGGKLKLYFPHNLDTKKNPDIVRNLLWMKDAGFKYSVINNERCDILYPSSFDISKYFEKRNPFTYSSGLNKAKGKKMSKDDFMVFVFSKFLKSSGICEKSYSYISNYSDKNYSNSKLKYFHRISGAFENKSDNLIFTEDLKPNVEPIDYVKGRLLSADPDKSVLQILTQEYVKKNKEELLKELSDSRVRKVYLPDLKVKGLKGDLFEDIINRLNDIYGVENFKVYYNIIIGEIFSKDFQSSEVEIDIPKKGNHFDCGGFLITETYLKLLEMNIFKDEKDTFNSNVLSYHKDKSSWYFNPNILYKSLINHCENINKILKKSEYDLHQDDNVRTFLSGMMEDLSLGMKSLGMFLVDDIDSEIKNC
tara:strand:+ start:3463 stop:4599 length:1137 start_codon:yes stop_codon:yes gene_type:complete